MRLADEKADANMELRWETLTVGDVSIEVPTFINYRKVKAGDELRWHNASDAVPEPPSVAKAAKRPRRKP